MRLTKTRRLALAAALAGTTAWAAPDVASAAPVKGGRLGAKAKGEYGPLFEDEAASDTAHASKLQKNKTPLLSVGKGSFCFLDGSRCKASLLINAGVAAGLRVPASDAGPDMPYSQFNVHGGIVVRPFMWAGRDWHPWGLGVVASWSRGTGSVTVRGDAEDQDVADTKRTDATRIGLLNQFWLTKKAHGLHIDVTLGAVRSQVLTTQYKLWGTHAEVGFGVGGWATLFAGADFLDRDTRLVLGLRAHGMLSGPIIALAIAGMAIGGAL
jgi:hypothetical protein